MVNATLPCTNVGQVWPWPWCWCVGGARRCYLCPHHLLCGCHPLGFRVLGQWARRRCVECNKNKCWALIETIQIFYPITPLCWVQYARVSADVSSSVLGAVHPPQFKGLPAAAAGAAYQVAQEAEQKHAEKPDDELSPCYEPATVQLHRALLSPYQ